MRIALDPWVLAKRFRHQGTSVYARHVFREFGRTAQNDADTSFCLFSSANGGIATSEFEELPGLEVQKAHLLRHDRLWKLGGASLAARKAGADVLFAPAPALLPVGRVPLVCTIHDTTPVVAPSHSAMVLWQQRYFLRAAVKASRRIITVSECSKADIVRVFGLKEDKIAVVYNGVDRTVFNEQPADAAVQRRVLEKIGVCRPYIFHHGTIQPRKNLARLIEAYRRLVAGNRNLEFDLVLAGGLGWEYEEIVRTAGSGEYGRVVLAGALEDAELAALLKGASLVVIPSLYEGFCLPMVEAMACGAPVIAANASCLPEISGGVLRYFDPLSLEDMGACMEQALEDSEMRNGLIGRGKEQAAKFDWSRCARETLVILRESSHP
ncbi:MAG TPA: glycosyltransferase family 1 protein [Candidatus Angelobacter sp.]